MSARTITSDTYEDYPYLKEVEIINLLKVGVIGIEFENMYNHSAPVIKAGSFIEANNVMYLFESDEAIQGDISSYEGTVYIKTQTDSNGDLQLVYDTGELPEWNRVKKGYYDGQSRYIGSLVHVDSVYHHKLFFDDEYEKEFEAITVDGTSYTPYQVAFSEYYKAFYFGCLDNDVVTVIKTTDGVRFEVVETIDSYSSLYQVTFVEASADAIYLQFSYSNSGTTNYISYVAADGETFTYASVNETQVSTPVKCFDYYNGYYIILRGIYLYYSTDLSTWNIGNTGSYSWEGIYHCGSNFVSYYNYSGVPYVYYSSELSTWNSCTLNAPDDTNGALCQHTDNLLGFGRGQYYCESTDGITFTQICSDLSSTGLFYTAVKFKGYVYAAVYNYLYKIDYSTGTSEQLGTNYTHTILKNDFIVIYEGDALGIDASFEITSNVAYKTNYTERLTTT